MLKAYLDDSGKADSDSVVVVAGFVSGVTTWDRFETRWQKFLTDYEIKGKFHTAPFESRCERPYSRWADDKYNSAKAELLGLLKEFNLFGIAAVAHVESFNKWQASHSSFFLPDPHYFCLDKCMHVLVHAISEHPRDEGVDIYIEQDTEHQKLGRSIAEWHKNMLKKSNRISPLFPDPNRSITINYGSPIQHLPMQVADVLAHSFFREYRDYLSNGRTFVSKNEYLAAISTNITPLVFLDEVAFQIDFSKRTERLQSSLKREP